MKIKIILCKVGEKAVVTEVDNVLESFQKLVGGYIQLIFPFDEDVAFIVNEEGKINGMPLNHTVRDNDGKIIDVLAGDFCIVAAHTTACGKTCGIPDELVEKYLAMFSEPEGFFRLNNRIYVSSSKWGAQKIV